ncbi:unnamed protein product [Cunninghamella echinulata]
MILPPLRGTSELNSKNNIQEIDTNILKHYLNQGGSCNIRHPGGLSLLCWAIKSESTLAIQLLLDHWCSKEDRSKDRIVDLFCYPSKHGVTPIHMLANQGFMQGFYLFEHYHAQQQEQQKGLLKHILLSSSPTLSPSTSSSTTFMDWLNIVDEKGKTPLHYAVQMNQCQAVHYLLYHGASSVIKDQLGHTPLTLALLHQPSSSSNFSFDMIQLLIHTLNDEVMTTLLQRPHQYQLSDQLWHYLFQYHYEQLYLHPNEKDRWIYLSVFWNRHDILVKLLQYQKDYQELPYFKTLLQKKKINSKKLDETDDSDDDPLYLAVQQRKLDMVEQLCQAGYSSKISSDGFNPCLLYAATHGFLEMIPLLYTTTTSNHCMELCLQLAGPTFRSQLSQQFNSVIALNKLSTDPMNIASIISIDPSF